MSAPTVWEEGRMPGRRVTRLAVSACALLVMLDLVVTGRLSPVFDAGFVLVCVGAALAVRPEDFFRVGVMAPFLMLGCATVLAITHPVAVANAGDGFVQAVISGLAHHSGGLFAADVLALLVLAVRHRVASLRRERVARHESTYVVERAGGYSNRDTSPRPTRVTSGAPEEKSTTVVGSDEVSPQSRTASNR